MAYNETAIFLWHYRFGHLAAQNLQIACRVTVGMPNLQIPHDMFKYNSIGKYPGCV